MLKKIKEVILSGFIGIIMGLWVVLMFVSDGNTISVNADNTSSEEPATLVAKVDLTNLLSEQGEDEQADERVDIESVEDIVLLSSENIETVANVYAGTLSEHDQYILAKIAMAEAEGEDTEGKALVICVVLNRVESDSFPDAIWDVITQDRQFEGYTGGRYDLLEPSEDCWAAIAMVENGWDESQNALYFETTGNYDSWQDENLTKLFTHGNHVFYAE